MMKPMNYLLGITLGLIGLTACSEFDHPVFNETYNVPDGKAIYRPEEFAGQNWNIDTLQYCYKRAAYTDNLAIFWEKGFGDNLASPPQLNGTDMSVNLSNLESKLEEFYTYYRDKLQFVKSGSKSEKYRMMVMLQYSLDGTAYGGAYDNTIGAFWAAPNRLKDTKLNAVAHELGHSFQLQMIADGAGSGWGGTGGIFEMTSQWMLWQVNKDWIADETYHWDAFKTLTHKAFLHTDNIYHSPYVLEYWSQKHGITSIADLWRASNANEDVVQTYQKVYGLSQEQFVDEMFDCYQHLVNLDYSRVKAETRAYANSFDSFLPYLDKQDDGYYKVKAERCPENYGFNVIKLGVPAKGQTVSVDFFGLQGGKTGQAEGYTCEWWWCADYRYGFVGVTEDGETVTGTVGKANYDNQETSVSFTAPTDKNLKYLWFVVMGAPNGHWTLAQQPLTQWPYKVKFTGTEIK